MSLSIKVPALILLTLVGLLSLFGWAFTNDEEQVLRDLLDRQGRGLAQALSSFSVEPLLVEDYPVLETVLHAVGTQAEDVLSIAVLRDGTPVAGYQRSGPSEGTTFRHDIVFPTAATGSWSRTD